jgi:hypothetical protein
MDAFWKTAIWRQFGAAIDMLENALNACPESAWDKVWYVAYHTLFFLDLYLSESPDGFAPPPPFDAGELEPDILPSRMFTRDELLNYVAHGRDKCRAVVMAMTEKRARNRCGIPWLDITGAELIFYNLRHVQHHTGQLNLLLRQNVDSAPGWVRSHRDPS